MAYHQNGSLIIKRVASRSLSRYYPWILSGIVLLYLLTFPILKEPILITIPVIITAWFYHRRGGLIASLAAIPLNLGLIQVFVQEAHWYSGLLTVPGVVIGNLLMILISIATGYMREIYESLFRREQLLQSQERFLALSNMIVGKILAPSQPDKLFDNILNHLTNLFTADYGYIIRWDHSSEKAFLLATTNPLEASFLNTELNAGQTRIVETVLQTAQSLFVDDMKDMPSIIEALDLTKVTHPIRSAICLPLVARDFKFGTAILAYESPRHYSPEDLKHMERAGYQIALALWTARQDEINLQTLNETRTLMQIGKALSETERVGTGEVFQLIVDSARELMPQAEKSVIHLLEEEEQVLVAQAVSGLYEPDKEPKRVKMRLGEGVAGRVIHEGVTINIGDINTNPLFLPSAAPPAFRSLMVAPVQSGSRPIGTISVQSNTAHAFSKRDADLLNSLAIQSAIAIENTRLFETTQQRLREVNTLYQIIGSLVVSLDADQLMEDTIGLLQESFGYYNVQIYLLDPESRDLVLRHGSGTVGEELVREGYRLHPGDGFVGHVAQTGEPFMTNNVEDVLFFKRNPLLPETQFEMAVPIKIDNQVTGVLDIQQTPERNRFTDSDLHLISAIADHLAVVLQKASLYSNLQKSLQQEKEIRSQLVQSERLALVGRLLASVSHELNNPLQAIQNALFLLKEETSFSEQAGQDLDVILSEAERMAALIERLRGAYRPVRTNDFQAVDLNDLIENVHMLITTHMRHKEIAFNFLPDRELPRVSGLPDQIRQVILNLFLNAIEVMKPGGCLTVETEWIHAEDEAMLSVKDTGPGIDPEVLPFIFDPFMTTKQTGTGLGLTITRDIIQQHQGHIEAHNDPQGGAIFRVWLPINRGGQA